LAYLQDSGRLKELQDLIGSIYNDEKSAVMAAASAPHSRVQSTYSNPPGCTDGPTGRMSNDFIVEIGK